MRLADIQKAEIGGHARHAEHAVGGGHRRKLWVDFAEALVWRHHVFLPTEPALNDFSYLVIGALRGDDFTDAAGLHHAPNRHWRGIAGAVIHAATHVRVQRLIDLAHQDLTGAGLRHRHFLQPEILEAHHALRA